MVDKHSEAQDQSIKARKHQLFEAEVTAEVGSGRPFKAFLRETPAAPLSSLTKAILWAAGAVVALLLVAALMKALHHHSTVGPAAKTAGLGPDSGRTARWAMAPRLVVLLPVLLPADGPGPAALVGFDALQPRLGSPRLRLLDARPRADYDRGHLPGAVWVDVKAASTLAARPGGLADREAWSAWTAPLALGPDAEVLVYDGGRQLDAARVWWLLTYLGVPRVGLVDGNFGLWAKEGRPVSAEAATVEPRPFPVAFRADRHATRADVLAALDGRTSRVVDARSEAEHTGSRAMSRRAGHVPTACHLEWSEFVGPDGRFLDEGGLRAKVERAGVKPGEPVITHCQGGGRASVDAFVPERLGHPSRNYYLGWSDWGNADETPVAKGKEPAGAAPKP